MSRIQTCPVAESGAAVPQDASTTGMLNDPRLDLCTNTDDELTAFAWVEPRPDAKWVVVSDADKREVYEVAESLPVRVTTTDGTAPESSKASFPIEEYAADGTELREYTLKRRSPDKRVGDAAGGGATLDQLLTTRR